MKSKKEKKGKRVLSSLGKRKKKTKKMALYCDFTKMKLFRWFMNEFLLKGFRI